MAHIFPGRIQALAGMAVFISMVLSGTALFADSTATAVPKAGSIYRVHAASREGNPDGSTWRKAYRNIQAAVDAAHASGGGEVWVAAGQYKASSDPVLTMKEGVALYGGFSGTENFRDDRDWSANKTIIDGEHRRRCVHGADDAILDGFVITGGRSDSASGGGMLNDNASPRVSNCVFQNNKSYRSGGALYNESFADSLILNCEFINNESGRGGAIGNRWGQSVNIKNSRFVKNVAGDGGAIHNDFSGSVSITGSLFFNNQAQLWGGALCNRYQNVVLDDCAFLKNKAYLGGAVSNEELSAEISKILFSANRAVTGGGLYNKRATGKVTNSLFLENKAFNEGGAVAQLYSSDGMLMNCTIVNNKAATAGGVHIIESSPKIVNSIIWGNSGGQISLFDPASNPSVSYSCVEGGFAGVGNIATDPAFLNAPYSVQLLPESPCINAGTLVGAPAKDFLNRARPLDGNFDMGAYEGSVAPSERCTLTLEVTSEELGRTVPPAGSYELAKGDRVPLLALPQGAAFSHWSGNASEEHSVTVVDMDSSKTVTAVFSPNRLYVNAAGTAFTPDGQSWATAFQDIQSAVDAAWEQKGAEIWVAEGTYTNTEKSVVKMKEDVALYGGFAGTESSRTQRDWNTRATVIKSEGQPHCVEGADNALLDGFILTGALNMSEVGGGVRNFLTSLAVANCLFTENTAFSGAAIGSYYAETTATNCVFTNNTAISHGGAISNAFAQSNFTNCSFFGNKAIVGGAIYSVEASTQITNAIIWANMQTQIEGDAEVSYSCVQGGFEGTGNIADNPLFLQAPEDLRLHLQSPCIDTGTSSGAPATDMLGQARPQGAGVDMGAYEKSAVPPGNQYTLTIEVSPAGLGESFPPAGTYQCAPGDEVTIEAFSPGISFSHWTGDAAGNNRKLSLVMDSHKSITAHFQHRIYFVNEATAAATPNGLSWASAFPDIQSAITATQGGGEIWVAAGTYTRPGSLFVVTMAEQVFLYGGFSGNESAREQRDWDAHPTIIDGESERVVVIGANHSVLDGFIITRGKDAFGAGMKNSYASPVISNCTFIDNETTVNSHGGGMHNMMSSPVISHCHFIRNSARNYGGAIANFYQAPTITDCSFTDNEARSEGGAVYNNRADTVLRNCSFIGNTTGGWGGAIMNIESSSSIINCIFKENNSQRQGGAVANYSNSSPEIINSIFVKNSTEGTSNGGAIVNSKDCSPTIINCSFTENSAGSGGAIYNIEVASPKIWNSILWANTPDEIADSDGTSAPEITYSCIQGGHTGLGNIDSNPRFIHPPDNLQQAAASPCIDTGTTVGAPKHDILGRKRPRGAGVDMGAYETIPDGEDEFLEGEDDDPSEGEPLLPREGEPSVALEGEDTTTPEGENTAPEEGENSKPREGEDSTVLEGEDDSKPDDDKARGCNCGKSKALFEDGLFLDTLKKNLSDWLLTGLSVMILLTFAAHRRS
ncbi:MAG: hypothetical protein GX130_01950 [Candidatus Hydrogenedens sp.]|jgi:predicted outer membrane repeat protein|nr:hypothetical protein [Candidatus Hydrogenedens sp.]